MCMRFGNLRCYLGYEGACRTSSNCGDPLKSVRDADLRDFHDGFSLSGFSTADARAWTICSNVTNPRRLAPARVAGSSSISLYMGSRSRATGGPVRARTRAAGWLRSSRFAGSWLHIRPNLNVGFHHRRGMGHADINEVFYACVSSRLDRAAARSQIDIAELRCLRGIGMCDANELDECVCGCYLAGVRTAVESIAGNCLTACWKFSLRTRPD